MMEMTPNEIRRMYSAAKHKGWQIPILAQLNDCSTDTIREILGLSPRKRRSREKSTQLCCTYTIQLEEFYYSDQREAVFLYEDAQEARRAQVTMASRRSRFGFDGVSIRKQGNTIILRKEPGEGC